MSTRGTAIATLLAAALAAGCTAQTGGGVEGALADGRMRHGTLAFEPCSLSAVGATAVEAQCTRFEVPEDHAAPAGPPASNWRWRGSRPRARRSPTRCS